MRIWHKYIAFYWHYTLFHVREQFSDLGGIASSLILFPFFNLFLAKLWLTFNASHSDYTFQEILIYLGVTEALFMTFLVTQQIKNSSSDFSVGLARPRSWILMQFFSFIGRCLGDRLLYLLVLMCFLLLMQTPYTSIGEAFLRFLLLLPVLCMVQALMNIFFASAQILWHETSYLVLPVSKVFLALGGVFGPLADYSEKWKSILLQLPPSDLFFQVGHFCIKGAFYRLSVTEWSIRILLLVVVLWLMNYIFFYWSKKYHQSYGG